MRLVVHFACLMCLALPACGDTAGVHGSTDDALPVGSSGSGEGNDPGANAVVPVPQPPGTPGSDSLFDEATRIQSTAVQSTYSHATFVNEATRTFDFDCSGFLNYALAHVVPDAFADLQSATLHRPTASSYVQMISVDAPKGRWARITDARDLRGGDIVAWLEPAVIASTNTGHVMVVQKAPFAAATPLEIAVTVIDSAESGHGPFDARTIRDTSGVGEGIMVLAIDQSGAATGYRWSTDADSVLYPTTIALGRLH